MKAFIYPITEDETNFRSFVRELVVQKANFFVLNGKVYVLDDERNEGLRSLIAFAKDGNYNLLDGEFDLLIDIKQVSQVFKA